LFFGRSRTSNVQDLKPVLLDETPQGGGMIKAKALSC